MNKIIGNKLRSLRKSNGFSQEFVAEHLSISQSAYARIESGESSTWTHLIDPICNTFQIQPYELFENESIIINKNQKGGNSNNAYIINQLSDRLIEQYENQIEDYKIRLNKCIEEIEKLNKSNSKKV